jgi:hypothetical protein
MTARQCGGCTLCCQLVGVRELSKPSFQHCIHERTMRHLAGPGCAIYDKRPHSCRMWRCLWLTSPADDWPDAERPDRVGFVVDEVADLIRINGDDTPAAQIWVAKGHDDDWRA